MTTTPFRPAWTFDDIVDANPPEPGQTRSRLDHLRSIGAVNETTLCRLAAEMENRDAGCVGVLFQLPFQVRVEADWVALPTSPDSIVAQVSFAPAVLTMTDAGTFRLYDAAEAPDRGWSVTQGFASFEVWGKRQRPYARYLEAIESRWRPDQILVHQSESWIDNRPITVRDFELNFARRLRIETSAMLRRFLPAQSVATRSEVPTPRWTYGFVPMLSPGKVTHTETIPVARHLFDMPLEAPAPAASQTLLSQAMANPHRNIGQFEHQLFALERLRREGEIALSVIGTAALIEWLLRTRTSETGEGARLVDLLSQQRSNGLPSDLIDRADHVRKGRNRMVHGAPPERNAINGEDSSVRPGAAQPGSITSEEARGFIETAFELFRALNISQGVAPRL